MDEQELAAAGLGGPDRPDVAPTVELVQPQSFEGADGSVDGGVGGPQVAPAVPSAVGHLLAEQVAGQGVEPVVVMFEVGQDGQDHAGDARLAPPPPTVIEPAVGLKPLIEQGRAGSSCRPVVGRQAKVAEQKQADLNANDVEQAMKIIAGTARSMGITVEA